MIHVLQYFPPHHIDRLKQSQKDFSDIFAVKTGMALLGFTDSNLPIVKINNN